MAGEIIFDVREQALTASLHPAAVAMAIGKLELKPDSPLSPEGNPVPIPSVSLLRGTDGVITIEPEGLVCDGMQPSELRAKPFVGIRVPGNEIEPFEDQE